MLMKEQEVDSVVRQGTISPTVVQIQVKEPLVALRNNNYLKENLRIWVKEIKAVSEVK